MASKLLGAKRSRIHRKVQQRPSTSRAVSTSKKAFVTTATDVPRRSLEMRRAQAQRAHQLKLEAHATQQRLPSMRKQRRGVLQRAEHQVNQPRRFNTSNRILKNAARKYSSNKGMQKD